ncbi:heat shock protein Hsp33 [Xanthomonas citri pv. fuscans]|uniref:Heat shock protein Hsp33 n=1 Tax=Xanthomonas citri pv. fuscans TaxID=366649 RepID=A0AB34QBN8_XANCI|nr:Hsp33 family molecular chaperone HslO [Xanthomonas citri]ATS89452.1 Hsp33 family molecular chaperone HslO [Xanthomonas citri pv. phaseoli var. fuscans]AZU16947.1 heat shock protein Hsp33 [Xanthomonas citri pv. fuscans]AZU21041.1 heat shock protein Hsp33 [Xanthomonas citri pv. fuscans]AZU92209.1 heat shock protein Hsp33 [Xanthomonas citri pv. fuscans]KGU56155.1 heat shock protein Hsp33 [Xanthomonas citri pv. fuscans]
MTDHDQLSRFLLPAAGVRGVHVRLTKAWHDIQGAAEYPPAPRQLLGEAAVAAALFTGHTKVDGRLSVQLRGNDILRTLFAECTAAGTLRGIVQLAEGADAPTDLRELGEAALLAITIENPGLDPREPQRYQSLVGMQAPDLAEAFETYFQQSEQLPTRLLLAAGPDQAAGLLLQKLPGDEGDTDGWTRIGALFDTLGAPELLSVAGQDLLHRLFHEEEPQLLGSKPLSFGCSCSRERVASMLQSLGEEEARAAAEATGEVEVRCEFCGREYHFPLTALDVIFNAAQPSQEAPERLQ